MSGGSLVWVRGGGDLGTGVAHRLHRAGFPVVVTEVSPPLVIRRAVSFANAIYEGRWAVEGVIAEFASSLSQARRVLNAGNVPVLGDPSGENVLGLAPQAMVDARMRKQSAGVRPRGDMLVLGLGPGFVVGEDVDAIIETQRGHYLGRVILSGSAAPDSGTPGLVGGVGPERVLYSPGDGTLSSAVDIGDRVVAGQVVATVSGQAVVAGIAGVVRGLLHDGQETARGSKIGDIDPRGIRDYCFTISDKARAVGGGVLEAVLFLSHARARPPVSPRSTHQAG